MSIEVELANEQHKLLIDESRLIQAAKCVLAGEGIAAATVSIAVVDDATIHALNRQYLAHDYPTDVLSFLLEQTEGYLEGEVIVSADTAAATAARFGWPPADELLLYVVHGCLHLAGYDDQTDEEQAEMRQREAHYLELFGLRARYEE